jgi:hypothetical protein
MVTHWAPWRQGATRNLYLRRRSRLCWCGPMTSEPTSSGGSPTWGSSRPTPRIPPFARVSCGRLAPGRYPWLSALETPPVERSVPATRATAPLLSGWQERGLHSVPHRHSTDGDARSFEARTWGGGGPGSRRRERVLVALSVWPIMPDPGLKSQVRPGKENYRGSAHGNDARARRKAERPAPCGNRPVLFSCAGGRYWV